MRGISGIQTRMLDAAKGSFAAAELEALRVVIRITVEFQKHLEANKISNYVCETVFSGTDSFLSVVHAYSVLEGAETRSHLKWESTSPSSLKEQFRSLYPIFIGAQLFEQQCRLLLDLFKIQLSLAAMTYDCEGD